MFFLFHASCVIPSPSVILGINSIEESITPCHSRVNRESRHGSQIKFGMTKRSGHVRYSRDDTNYFSSNINRNTDIFILIVTIPCNYTFILRFNYTTFQVSASN